MNTTSSAPTGFKLHWAAGASAQIELFSPTPGSQDPCKLKYTPAVRTTLRPPMIDRQLSAAELGPIDQQLESVATAASVRDGSVGGGASIATTETPLDLLTAVATDLHTLILPPFVVADLRGPPLFVELGVDDRLLAYPWELMHDGTEFLALAHNVARFVNLTLPSPLGNSTASFPREFPELRVLLVGVAKPQKRPAGQEYERLDAVDAEIDEAAKLFAAVPGANVKVLKGSQATFTNVRTALQKGAYHIIHYSGHANSDSKNPRQSSLVLFDADLTTAFIYGILSKNPPVLCFVNACETAKVALTSEHFNVFGLARSFLETGTYLLGTRWKVGDKAAAAFAKKFYDVLVNGGRPLGEAVRQGRSAARDAVPPEDLAWASYVLYGDPRMYFLRRY